MTTVEANREKNFVAMTSLVAAVGITAFKIVVGYATGSLGILAEAAHSGLDLVAAGMTWIAIRSASRPADREHPFGHGKVENLSALFESLLLIGTCGWILYSAIYRLVHHDKTHVEVTAWSFVVMATSIVVDYSRSRALRRAAVKHSSQALEADALHFETDIWSSFAVIAGLLCVKLGQWAAGWGWLRHADAVSALAVAMIAALVTVRLGMRTVGALLDGAPPGMQEKITAMVEAVPGILDAHHVRVRSVGPQLFVDIHVTVDGERKLREAHELMDRVEEKLQQEIRDIDVTIHAEPGTVEAAPAPASSAKTHESDTA